MYIIIVEKIDSFKHCSCHMCLKILRLQFGGLPLIKNALEF
jgi:hypothetical protein